MSYVVRNLTSRTIILSDIRAEIGPHKMLDLEKVAEREKVDRSYDLRLALDTKRLRVCSDGVVSTIKPKVVERVIEQHHYHEQPQPAIDEARLAAMMRVIIKENQPVPQQGSNEEVLNAMAAIQKQLEGIDAGDISRSDMPNIDPAIFAEMQGKAVAKLSENIETGNKKTGRKVILKNTRLGDLADELD